MSNGVEVQLPGGIGGKASGSTVIIFLGFVAMAGAIAGQGYMLREEIRHQGIANQTAVTTQTTHFNEKVRDTNAAIERTCGKVK